MFLQDLIPWFTKENIKTIRLIILSISVFFSAYAFGDSKSTFVTLNFGDDISLAVPSNWKYQDVELSKHINIAADATIRLAGIAQTNIANDVLIAASAYTVHKTSSATLRLSVRSEGQISQAQMKSLTSSSHEDIKKILEPVSKETEKILNSIEGIKAVKKIRAELAYNKNLYCIILEFEISSFDGEKLQQTYVCPIGNKTVKLSTSYRKSERVIFKPVIEYIWLSLLAHE